MRDPALDYMPHTLSSLGDAVRQLSSCSRAIWRWRRTPSWAAGMRSEFSAKTILLLAADLEPIIALNLVSPARRKDVDLLAQTAFTE